MRSPSDPALPTTGPDPAALLGWAAQLRACSDVARSEALMLRVVLEERGLTGPAGDALAQSGRRVAGRLVAAADHAAETAAALVRAAHEAAAAQTAAAQAVAAQAAAAAQVAAAQGQGAPGGAAAQTSAGRGMP